jgi:hypothetical protein
LDPDAVLVTLDGKLVELACWGGVAARTVGVDVDDAIRVLLGLRAELDVRLRVLLRANRRKIRPGIGMPLIVVVIDELAHYLNGPDRRQNAEFANLLRDLVSRGRAVGIVVLAATQKPSTDVIRPRSVTCLGSAGRSGVRPRRRPTRSSGRAGRRWGIPPRRSIPPREASGCCCMRAASRCGCGPASWTTTT